MPILRRAMAECGRLSINCCCWKSSLRIEAAFAGRSDLDLLVAREDQHLFRDALLRLGFKRFPSVGSRDEPAVESFLAYDEPTGRIFHVHAHFRLVLGPALLKTHRFAVENYILSRAVPHPDLPVRILDPATEAVILVVRSVLELTPSDPVALRRWRALTRKFELDRTNLAQQVNAQAVFERAAEIFDDASLAAEITDAIFDGRPLAHQMQLRRRIRAALAPARIYGRVEAGARLCARSLAWVFGAANGAFLHAMRPWSRRAPGGGAVVAILGVDGSGKTTAVTAIREWLRTEVDVVPVYFGTGGGRPGLLLLPFKAAARIVAPLFKAKPRGSSHGAVSDRPPGPIYSALLMVWATVAAAEKRAKLIAARRGANRGLIVLADRYPQDWLSDYNDGPLLPRVAWAPQWLRRFEARAYALARRIPPDLVLKLEVTPETAAHREPDMDQALIRRRVDAVRRLSFPGARAVTIDAEKSLEKVLQDVKREIWRQL